MHLVGFIVRIYQDAWHLNVKLKTILGLIFFSLHYKIMFIVSTLREESKPSAFMRNLVSMHCIKN